MTIVTISTVEGNECFEAILKRSEGARHGHCVCDTSKLFHHVLPPSLDFRTPTPGVPVLPGGLPG